MIPTDLFEFAYVPDWYMQLDELAAMALPESWRFKKPAAATKNTDTPILERYINMIFRKQSIDYNTNPNTAAKFFHVENEYACFHTGLYNHRYKAIYGCFERNKKLDTTFKWYFRGFCDEVSPRLKYIEPLPERPSYPTIQNGINFNPEWSIRVNVEHILGDAENLERISLACAEYGSTFFANGASPSGVLEHPGVKKNPEKLRNAWERAYGGKNSHRVAVLEEGTKFSPISIPNNEA